MVHTIKATDVHNLALRSANNDNLLFRCDHHETKTKDLVASSFNELVRNSAFKSLFPNFLPNERSAQEAQLNIRVTKESLIVENTADANQSKTVRLSDLNASNADEQAILTTCQTLIQKVDKVYKKCMSEGNTHSSGSRTPSVATLEADLRRAEENQRANAQWAADSKASQGLQPLHALQLASHLAHELGVFQRLDRDVFAELPLQMRQDVFLNLYEIKGTPTPMDDSERWSIGEKYFFEDNYNGVEVTSKDRAKALRLTLLKELAAYYFADHLETAEAAAELREFYRTLPQEERSEIETQLWLLHGAPKNKDCAEGLYGHKAFFNLAGCSATSPQRARAIWNYIIKQFKP